MSSENRRDTKWRPETMARRIWASSELKLRIVVFAIDFWAPGQRSDSLSELPQLGPT